MTRMTLLVLDHPLLPSLLSSRRDHRVHLIDSHFDRFSKSATALARRRCSVLPREIVQHYVPTLAAPIQGAWAQEHALTTATLLACRRIINSDRTPGIYFILPRPGRRVIDLLPYVPHRRNELLRSSAVGSSPTDV